MKIREIPDSYFVRPEGNMHMPAIIEQLARVVGQTPFDWARITQRFKERITPEQFRKIDASHKKGEMLEIHLRIVLEDIAAKVPGAIVFDPIPEDAETEHFRFTRDKNFELRLLSEKKDDRATVTDYDLITVIYGIPVIWEVKMLKNATDKGKGNFRDATNGQRVRKVVEPVLEYFINIEGRENKCGYVLLTNKSLVIPSQVFANLPFSSKGGILAGFAIEHAEFQRQTDKKIAELSKYYATQRR